MMMKPAMTVHKIKVIFKSSLTLEFTAGHSFKGALQNSSKNATIQNEVIDSIGDNIQNTIVKEI